MFVYRVRPAGTYWSGLGLSLRIFYVSIGGDHGDEQAWVGEGIMVIKMSDLWPAGMI